MCTVEAEEVVPDRQRSYQGHHLAADEAVRDHRGWDTKYPISKKGPTSVKSYHAWFQTET